MLNRINSVLTTFKFFILLLIMNLKSHRKFGNNPSVSKMRKSVLLFWMALIVVFSASGNSKIKVGLIVNSEINQASEIEAMSKILDRNASQINYKLVSLDQLALLKDCDVVWYHRPDSVAITEKEKNLGKQFVDYVSGGGQLILSMEAVRLLNLWNLESTPIQTQYYHAVDEGFGRKLGFHGYRSHPLFDKMFGGAYTWHGKEDNTCRILGYFENVQPTAINTHVIGTLWEYIFYHPQSKVIWETPVAKGRILAIGSCLYYGKPNFHEQVLEQFTLNCLNYMKGNKMESPVRFWDYTPAEVLAVDFQFSTVRLSPPVAWKIPDTENKLAREATAYTYDLSTHRSLILGKEKAGIDEIWTHPFMSLRDFKTYLDLAGTDSLISLNDFTPVVEMHPNAMIRTYQIGSVSLKEIITAQITKPVIAVHYEWSGPGLNHIVTNFKSNLRFMWPYDADALGSICSNWSDALNAFVVTDKTREFCSLVGANLKGILLTSGRFDSFIIKGKKIHGTPTDKLQVAAAISYDVENRNAIDMIFVASNTGTKSVVDDYKTALTRPHSIFDSGYDYYTKYLSDKLSITTPDQNFNDGFRWSILRSAQFITNTPGIGVSLTAGNSSSRTGWGGAQKVSGRPGYAWYFGRDAVWSGLAFNDLGDFETVKEVLKTFIRYQEISGKIYHELTTSGSVHYDASDATPLFVTLMARYLQNSGDIAFVKENIGAVHKAMEYCYSTDTDGDHLIEIANVGHGWLEGGDLYGSKTEFYLVGLWNEALNDAAYLSEATENMAKQQQYANDAKTVNHILNTDFWNRKGYYNYGKKADGTFTDELIILPSVPVYFGVTEHDKSLEMVKQFGTSSFSTDWGLRMISGSNSMFNPTAYHAGNVWPLFTGWTSLAEYQTGRYFQGYSHIMSNLENYKAFSLGCVPEVLNGLIYKPGGVTQHQCWSETMVIQPVIEGLLGFRPDAQTKTMSLAPRFPFDWNLCTVKNLCIGETRVAFEMKKSKGKTIYTLTSTQPVTVNFEPVFSPGTQISRVTVNGLETPFSLADNQEYATIHTKVNVGSSAIVEIEYQEGVSFLPSFISPEKGKLSSGFHVLEQKFNDKVLQITLEGRPGKTYPLNIYLPDGYDKTEGVDEIKNNGNSVYSVAVSFGLAERVFVEKKIKVFLTK